MNEIVVGADRSDSARRAIESAAQLAADLDAPLHVVMCVSGTSESVTIDGERRQVDTVQSAKDYLAALELGASPPGITTHVSYQDPATEICAEAERLGAQIVVVGNRRVQGISRVLGSVAADVMRSAPCDVLIAYTKA